MSGRLGRGVGLSGRTRPASLRISCSLGSMLGVGVVSLVTMLTNSAVPSAISTLVGDGWCAEEVEMGFESS